MTLYCQRRVLTTTSRYSAIVVAIGVTVPALAQPKDAADAQLRQQLEALAQRCDEAVNDGDAVALAATFAQDAVLVTDSGPVYGREAIEKHYADLFRQVHFSNRTVKRDPYSPHLLGTAGQEVWSDGEWSLSYEVSGGGSRQLKGYWSTLQVREGPTWRTRLQMSNVTP